MTRLMLKRKKKRSNDSSKGRKSKMTPRKQKWTNLERNSKKSRGTEQRAHRK